MLRSLVGSEMCIRDRPDGVKLDYIGRPERASPSEGYSVAHVQEQQRIVLSALTPNF